MLWPVFLIYLIHKVFNPGSNWVTSVTCLGDSGICRLSQEGGSWGSWAADVRIVGKADWGIANWGQQIPDQEPAFVLWATRSHWGLLQSGIIWGKAILQHRFSLLLEWCARWLRVHARESGTKFCRANRSLDQGCEGGNAKERTQRH